MPWSSASDLNFQDTPGHKGIAAKFFFRSRFTGVNVGACWGGCIPTTQCGTVGDCSQCGTGEVCVTTYDLAGGRSHCVAKPASCAVGDCACLGASVCQAPYGVCLDEGAGRIGCECPVCR